MILNKKGVYVLDQKKVKEIRDGLRGESPRHASQAELQRLYDSGAFEHVSSTEEQANVALRADEVRSATREQAADML